MEASQRLDWLAVLRDALDTLESEAEARAILRELQREYEQPARPGALSEHDHERYQRLLAETRHQWQNREEGPTLPSVAGAMGFTTKAIEKWLRRLGINWRAVKESCRPPKR